MNNFISSAYAATPNAELVHNPLLIGYSLFIPCLIVKKCRSLIQLGSSPVRRYVESSHTPPGYTEDSNEANQKIGFCLLLPRLADSHIWG